MSTSLTVGKSTASDPTLAAQEAVAAALAGVASPTFAFAFSTDDYDPDAIASAMSDALGAVPWAGCSAAGVFAAGEWLPQGVIVGVMSAPAGEVGVGVGCSGLLDCDPRAAGREAVVEATESLGHRDPLRARSIILLPDGRAGVATDVLRGAAREAGVSALWAGGGSGHNTRPMRSVQYAHGKAHSHHVVAIALDTPHAPGIGICHGWVAFGPPSMVTRSKGDTIFELDYQPAFDVYQACARRQGLDVTPESFAAFAVTHPLGIPQADGNHVIRDPLAIAPGGGLRCVGDVPDGALVRMMIGDADALLEAALHAAQNAREHADGPVAGAIAFDCVSRSVALGTRTHDELACFRSGLGEGVPMMGCLTFGEIGTLTRGYPQFHNKTAVLLAFPE